MTYRIVVRREGGFLHYTPSKRIDSVHWNNDAGNHGEKPTQNARNPRTAFDLYKTSRPGVMFLQGLKDRVIMLPSDHESTKDPG